MSIILDKNAKAFPYHLMDDLVSRLTNCSRYYFLACFVLFVRLKETIAL